MPDSGISAVGDIPWGTHFCHFYNTKDDLLDILIPYFATGLANNEFCVWAVFHPLGEAEAREALIRAFPQAEQHLKACDIIITPYSQWYLENGVFNRDRMMDYWVEHLAHARAKGYTGMRMTGNEAWLTDENWQNFAEYERDLNDLIVNREIIILCTYLLDNARAVELFDVAHTHQFVLARRNGQWETLEAPALSQAKHELQALSQGLEQRVAERTRALAEANEQLRALSASLNRAREEEGRRIARELHDELGAALSSLRWDLEEVHKLISERGAGPAVPAAREKLEAMMRLNDETIAAVRRIASEMRPIMLDDLGLVEAIEWQAQQFRERTGISCHCERALESVNLSREQSTAVFRIFQEALTNILRHAGATRVDVFMEEESGAFVLTIRDNGKGITEEAKSQHSSVGLLGMQERAHLAGGTIAIMGSARQGTTVTVRIPVDDLQSEP